MPLVTLREVLVPAAEQGYAVGAFNANNLEYVQAIVTAATAEHAPVIVQASQGAIRHAGLAYITEMVRVAAREAPIPVVLHLDHGRDLELVRQCIEIGFTSVMFDGSDLPLEQNIRLTARVVEWARPVGVSVEGELGRVPRVGVKAEEVRALMTDPDQAARFARETGIDALAVAVGSVHQMTQQRAVLDVPRVAAIRRATGLPLVLHGSSGVAEDSLREAIRAGICKVNFATSLNVAFRRGLAEAMAEDPAGVDPRPYLARAREEVATAVRERIHLLGCSGRA
ncbi:MAG: class II fructose-bisphosphate aldolase [Bacillota bacterium]|nr:class II fructose-bisphosphate aldolase [Bacillota bacterium]MDI7249138.1 class II fructose-bisphosphate aldolase [Bacillota bacterium]